MKSVIRMHDHTAHRLRSDAGFCSDSDGNGNMKDVVLGYDSVKEYEENHLISER